MTASIRAVRALARLAKSADIALTGVDLSLPQYRVLMFLSEHDAAAASALASRLDVSRPSITALVDGLATRGLVERRPASTDRRRVEHRLTRAGEKALVRADQAIVDRLAVIAGHLDEAEAERAQDGLEMWGEALGQARSAFWNEAGNTTGDLAVADSPPQRTTRGQRANR